MQLDKREFWIGQRVLFIFRHEEKKAVMGRRGNTKMIGTPERIMKGIIKEATKEGGYIIKVIDDDLIRAGYKSHNGTLCNRPASDIVG